MLGSVRDSVLGSVLYGSSFGSVMLGEGIRFGLWFILVFGRVGFD